MSDRNLRRILQEIIDDLDAGRLHPRRPPRVMKWLGAPVLAASVGLGVGLGLGLGGCEGRAVGYSEDAGVQMVDADSNEDAAAAPPVDADVNEDAAAPPVDAGIISTYGSPPMEADAGAAEMDASVNPPSGAINSTPDYEIERDADAVPDPDLDPEPDAPAPE